MITLTQADIIKMQDEIIEDDSSDKDFEEGFGGVSEEPATTDPFEEELDPFADAEDPEDFDDEDNLQ